MSRVNLSEKQIAFAIHYARLHNASQAAKLAGFSPRTAYSASCRLLKKELIKLKIAEEEKKIFERSTLSQTFILKNLQDEFEASKKDGEHGNAIKALELLGKHLGMFKDTVERDALDIQLLIDLTLPDQVDAPPPLIIINGAPQAQATALPEPEPTPDPVPPVPTD